MLKAAVRNRMLFHNPAQGISLPRLPHREQLFLNPAQVKRLAKSIRYPYETLVYVLAVGGLRWGESAALRRGRIDVPRSRITVAESLAIVKEGMVFGLPKNHRRRTIVVPSFLRSMLNDHLAGVPADPEALVFTSPKGAPLRNTNFSRNIWKPAIGEAGMPIGLRIHDLRHTAAALMIAEGAHPEAIKRHMGHSSIKVTMDNYGHLFPSEADALAGRLDRAFQGPGGDRMGTDREATVVSIPSR